MTPNDSPAAGRIIQVSVSPGGVPKLPVERALVGPLGLDGDAHRDDTVHGGPHRAVALFAIEAIRRVEAEGHPIFPGSAGENFTTEGIEWADLPVGTRAAIGDSGLLLEISKPDNPCDTIAGSFSDGRSGRISMLTHPRDTRMYARVLLAGEVRRGDPVRILPPAADSLAATYELLDRIDAAGRAFSVAVWEAAAAAGFDIRVVADGELALAASPELPGNAFNRAMSFRELPNLLPRMVEWFRRNGTTGWIYADSPPWPGAVAERPTTTCAATPDEVLEALGAGGAGAGTGRPEGLTIREVRAGEAGIFTDLLVEAWPMAAPDADAWRAAIERLVEAPGHHYYVADAGGGPVGVGALIVRRRVGLLRKMAVLPAHRGRGIQRALIAHRAAQAQELGAMLVASGAATGGVSARNLAAAGLRPLIDAALYRVEPGAPGPG